MIRPLLYLLVMRLKNQLLGLLKSPGKLLYLLFIVAIIVISFIGNSGRTADPGSLRDIGELTAGLFALYLMLFVLLAKKGFDSGASLFNLSDVNLVFTAPFNPQSVLFFGLVQQLGTSLLLGFFLLFQFSWLRQLYGISFGILLLILFGYALTVFLAQLTAMVLYSIICSNEKMAGRLKLIFYGCLVLFAVWAIYRLLPDRSLLLQNLVMLGNHRMTQLFPVVGWISSIVAGVIAGQLPLLLTGSLLTAAYLAALICFVIFSRQDYYEDVLKTTEMNYSAITARKEGRVSDLAPRHVRLGKVGLDHGSGASAFYYKHKIENRRSRILFMSGQSLMFSLMVIALSFFMREAGILAIFAFSTYIQIFSVALGRLVKELTKPFIYLVPDAPMKKLLQNMRESVAGNVLEAVIIFVPVALILQLTLPEFLLCILARISFSWLFLAGNILVERVFGTVSSKVLVFFFYFTALIILALPGIIVAIVLTSLEMTVISATVTMLLAMAICNIPVALFVLYLCRNILQYAELNNR
jgi:hypothetical protein